MNTDPASVTYTLPIGTRVTLQPEQQDVIAALRAENAALRETLIDVTGQRNALQQDLHKALQQSGVL
jgi:hypothetical protein